MKLEVVCIKTGTKYGPEYVNRLHAMVRRHTTIPHRFLCLTDNPEGVACETAPVGIDLQGWWAKLTLFKTLRPRTLYIDLDTVIVGDIDPLLAYEGQFAAVKDWWWPGLNGSVYGIAPGFGWHIYENFRQEKMKEFYSDQEWITYQVPNADLWQVVAPGIVGSYKANHLQEGPGDYKLICFHGQPKPHELDGWVHEHWTKDG